MNPMESHYEFLQKWKGQPGLMQLLTEWRRVEPDFAAAVRHIITNETSLSPPDAFASPEELGEEYRRWISQLTELVLTLLDIPREQWESNPELQESVGFLVTRLDQRIRGLGPLQEFWERRHRGVEEIIVRGGTVAVIEAGRTRIVQDERLMSPEQRRREQEEFYTLITSLMARSGFNIGEHQPWRTVALPDSTYRLAAATAPLFRGSRKPVAAFNLRFVHERRLADVARSGTLMDARTYEEYAARLNRGASFPDLPSLAEEYMRTLQETWEPDRLLASTPDVPAGPPQGNGGMETGGTGEDIRNRLQEMVYRFGQSFLYPYPTPDRNVESDVGEVVRHFGWGLALALAWLVNQNAVTFMVSGPFASGKTTLMRALLYYLGQPFSPLSLEEYREIPPNFHPLFAQLIYAYYRDKLPAIIADAVTRMTPDLLVVPETTSPAHARAVVTVAQLGKKACTTIHANNAPGALTRFWGLAQEFFAGDLTLFERFVKDAFDLIIHVDINQATGARFVEQVILLAEEEHLEEDEYGLRRGHWGNLAYHEVYRAGRRRRDRRSLARFIRTMMDLEALVRGTVLDQEEWMRYVQTAVLTLQTHIHAGRQA